MNNKTMNTVRMAIGAAVVLGLAAACSMDEQPADKDKGLKAVQFTGDGIALVQSKSVSTARMADNKWEGNGDRIGVYMIGTSDTLATGTIKEGADNKEYKANGTGGTSAFSPVNTSISPTDTIYYPVTGYVQFIAYYPYQASFANFLLPITLPQNQNNQAAADVLYAPKTNGNYHTNTSDTVSLQFAHKLVSLKFNIRTVDTEGVTEQLTSGLTVTITNQNTQTSLNLVDGTVGAGNTSAIITAKTTVNSGTAASSEAIVLPNTGFNNMKFVFTTSEGAYEVAVPTSPASQWNSGYEYTYSVELKRNAIVINGTVNPWTAANGGTPINVDGQPPQ